MGFLALSHSFLGLLLLLITGSLAAGYAVGRLVGFHRGFASGQAQDKLMLRARAYQLGYCPICETGQEAETKKPNG